MAETGGSEATPNPDKDPEEEVASLSSLPMEMIVEILGALGFAEFVRFLDQVLKSNEKYRDKWDAVIVPGLRIAMLDNHEFTIDGLRWVLNRGFKISNFSITPIADEVGGMYGNTFDWVCIKGDLQIVRAYIDLNSVDVNTIDNIYLNNPLWLASEAGHLEVVEALLAAGAEESVNTPDGYHGSTPLSKAVEGGHLEMVEALLAAGAGESVIVPNNVGATAIWLACRAGHLEIAHALLTAGAGETINTPENEYGATPLRMACKGNHLEVVLALLAFGVEESINRPGGQYRETPLYSASDHGNLEMVKALLAAGAEESMNLRTTTIGCQSPLSIAKIRGHSAVVLALKDAAKK